MRPGFSRHYPLDRRQAKAEFGCDLSRAESLLMQYSHAENDGIGQFCVGVPLALRSRLGVQTRSVSITASQPFGVQTSTIPVTASQSFRVQPGRVEIPFGPFFGMLTGSTSIASGVTALGEHVESVGLVGAKPEMPSPFIGYIGDFIGSDVIVPDARTVTRVPFGVVGIACVTNLLAGSRPFAGCKPPRIHMGATMSLLEVGQLAIAVFIGAAGPQPARFSDSDFWPEALASDAASARILISHPEPPTLGATPRSSYPRRGDSCCTNYTSFPRVAALQAQVPGAAA